MAVHELVQVLSELSDIHYQLLDLAHSKELTLIHNQVNELNLIVNKETKLLRQIADLEKKRIFETDRYVVGKGYRPNPAITVGELVRITTKSEDKKALSDAQKELLHVIEQVDKANKLNQELVKQSIAFIDYSLNMLAGVETEATYQKPQQQHTGIQRNSMFDTRA